MAAAGGGWWRLVAAYFEVFECGGGWWRVVASGGGWWRVVESFIRCQKNEEIFWSNFVKSLER